FRVPKTGIEGKVCMGYLIARALTDGAVTLESFTDEAVQQPDVLALLERVEMRLDPSLQPGANGARSARVTVRLRDGQAYRGLYQSPRGSRDTPMTDADMEAKFRECASRALDEPAIGRALAMIGGLEELGDVRELGRVLRGQG